MKKVAQFLASYWYVYNNSIFGEYAVFTPELKTEIFKGFGIQLAFAIASIGDVTKFNFVTSPIEF